MRISDSTTFSEVEQIKKQNAKKMIESLLDTKPIHKTIRAAVDIIKLKYNQNITLDLLAKEVFVSTAYLSTLFKQELGVYFLDYLHSHNNMNIHQIRNATIVVEYAGKKF
jgi:two-component system, response regulator YesN